MYGIIADYKGTPVNEALLMQRVLLYIRTVEESVGDMTSLYISEQAKYFLSLIKSELR